MKVQIENKGNRFSMLIPQSLSVASEAEFQKLCIVEDLLSIMKRKGIRRKELASRMSFAPSYVSPMLSGPNDFTIETLVRTARAVNARLKQTLISDEK